ncbi:MAG TPA: acyl-CoA dehydrogenase [Streptosporangiaceae bacterium]|nr:acyl-CoA dehydrogenase [Streptosporangiaceae bacterium]
MALGISDEHRQLAATVAGWAGRHTPPEVVRACLEDPGAQRRLYLEELAPSLAAQGLLGLHLPERAGGQGYGLPELAITVEELGRCLVPGAFLPTVFAGAVLAAAQGAPDGTLTGLLTSLADGTLTGAVSLAPGLTATQAPGDDGLVLDGACGPVLGASTATMLVLPAASSAGQVWVVVDAADVVVTPLESIDLTRDLAEVRADAARVAAGRILTGVTTGQVRSLAATLFGAEASGLASWAVATAAAYAKTRYQFGRPIGQFQGVKHRCAWMLTRAEQASAAAWDAAREASEFPAAVAAVVAADAAVRNTHDCIQILGGIGFTWEHDAHLYYRRALSLRALLGEPGEWAVQAARLALAGAPRSGGVELPTDAEPLRAQVRQELADIAAADPAQHSRLLAEGGFVAPHLPRPWGRAAQATEQLVIAAELRAAGLRPPGLGIGAWMVPSLVQHGTPAQQERFLPATLRGETVWCQLFSEPGAGSDLAGLSTRAERADGGWRLTGQKVWTSVAAEAAWAFCVARTDPAAPRHDGITYFLVDMASPGVTVRPLREMTGESLFNEVFLDGVFVPDELVVGGAGNGWRVARTTLANERVTLAQSWTFGCDVPALLGTVRGLDPEPGREVLAQVGRLACEGHALDVLGERVTLKRLSGTEPGATGSVRKLLSMHHAQEVANECWGLTGAGGAQGGTHWAQAVLFTRALTIGGGTTEIQLNIIGEQILGLPRDPAPGT